MQPESHLLSLLSLLSISFFHQTIYIYIQIYIYINILYKCICILNEYTYTCYIVFKHILDLQHSLGFFFRPRGGNKHAKYDGFLEIRRATSRKSLPVRRSRWLNFFHVVAMGDGFHRTKMFKNYGETESIAVSGSLKNGGTSR